MKDNIEVNVTSGVGSIWLWGFIYFWAVQRWEFVDAFFWIYVLIDKHL